MILHQATGVRGRTVVAVQVAPQHPEHGHLLPAMMRRVRQPARQNPSPAVRGRVPGRLEDSDAWRSDWYF